MKYKTDLLNIIFKLPFFRSLDSHMKEVMRGAGVAFVVKVLGAGLSFVFNILLARRFGAEGTGIYFIALTITTIAATLGRFGLQHTILRFISEYMVDNNWGFVKAIYRKGIGLVLGISLFISFSLLYIAKPLAQDLFNEPDLILPIQWMSLAVPPLAILFLQAEALKGLSQIRDSQVLQGVILPTLTTIGIIFLGEGFGIIGAVWVYVAATILASLFGVFLWACRTPNLGKIRQEFPARKLLESCIPLFWVQVFTLMINWSATFALGMWGTKSEIGIFGAALRTAMLTSFILTSVNSVAAPKFSALYTQGNMKALSETARKSAAMMTLFAIPIFLFFIFMPDFVMSIFGNDFRGGGLLLRILTIGQFVNVATGSVGFLLIMTGNEKQMRNNTIVIGIITIILNITMVPYWGGFGAAIATSISMATMNIGALYLVWKKLGILTLPLYFQK